MRVILFVLLTIFISITICISADWTQLQNNPQRTGYTSEILNSPFTLKWTWNRNQSTCVRISYQVQAITGGGRVYIGACDGKMYALSETNGTEQWSYATGGPILGTAVYSPTTNRVFFGSHDSYIYCLDANNGNLVWKYKTGAGVWAAPLYVSNTIYVGSRDGYFYALRETDGSVLWQYPASGQDPLPPICAPASYSSIKGWVYVCSSDMRVRALNANTGQLMATSPQLNGIDFGWYWPVIHEQQGYVMVRTCNWFTYPFNGPYPDANGDGTYENNEQDAINWLNSNPTYKFFFLLDYTTLNEVRTMPLLFQGGAYGRPCPPIIDSSGNCYVIVNISGYMSRCRLARMNLSTGILTYYSNNNSNYYRIIGDEGSAISMAGTKIIVSNPQSMGGEDTSSSTPFAIIRESQNNRDGFGNNANLWIFPTSEIPIMSSEVPVGSQVWHFSPDWAPASYSNKTLYWLSDGRCLAAVGCQ